MRDGLYLGGVSLPYLSSLRIYLPRDEYSERQARYIDERLPEDQNRVSVDAQELADSLGRISRANGDPLPTDATDRVRVIQLTGDSPVLYSPSQVVTRSASASVEFLGGPTAQLAKLVVAQEFWTAQMSRVHVSPWFQGNVQTRTSNWGIPFSWFTLVSAKDRTEVVEAGGRVLTVRIQVPLPLAVERSREILATLAESAPELDLYEEVEDLHEWLSSYSDQGAVELDYGPVANRVYPDESPADVRMGLECLAEGDLTGAAAAYRRLAARWIPIRQLARAN